MGLLVEMSVEVCQVALALGRFWRLLALCEDGWFLSRVILDSVGVCAHIYYALGWKATVAMVLLFACSADSHLPAFLASVAAMLQAAQGRTKGSKTPALASSRQLIELNSAHHW